MANFADIDAVAGRLGRNLTDPESDQVGGVLTAAAGLIRAEASKPADWNPDPIPAYLIELSIQKAIAGLVNPQSVASESETLGAHSHSVTYQRANDGSVFISDDEGRQIRFAVYGRTSGTAHPRSRMIHRLTRDREVAYLVEGDPPPQ